MMMAGASYIELFKESNDSLPLGSVWGRTVWPTESRPFEESVAERRKRSGLGARMRSGLMVTLKPVSWIASSVPLRILTHFRVRNSLSDELEIGSAWLHLLNASF